MSLLDVKTAAERLGVHYDTALDFIHSGRLRGTRLGGRRKIQVDERDLNAFIEASKTGPEAGPNDHRKPPKLALNHRGQKSLKTHAHQWRRAFRG